MALTVEQQERLAELEEAHGLAKELGEEFDEDEREELKDLRSAKKSDAKTRKMLDKFAKAKTVWCIPSSSDDESPTYVITQSDLQKLCEPNYIDVGDGKIHQVNRWADCIDEAVEIDRPDIEYIGCDVYQGIYFDTRFES